MKNAIIIICTLLLSSILNAQSVEEFWYQKQPADLSVYNRQDTLRGSVTEERAWWDLVYYELAVDIDPQKEEIFGSNRVWYEVLDEHNVMQLDLQEPLYITSVIQDGESLEFKREGNAYFIQLQSEQVLETLRSLFILYEGKPLKAKNAPWDGGFTWERDSKGKPFVATSCQGLGASIWWPCKDHMYDEPDSMKISFTVPKGVMAVANGRLVSKEKHREKTTFHWFVNNPISNYAVNANIGDYAHFSEVFEGEKGKLDCDYYVLRENLDKAKEHFKQVPLMLEAFEYWFGPYPFYEDGYKLVEVPYLGMEHQSSVTYGNKYQNGYLGRDLSGSGWGLLFDFIIIHESGHEWFANSITYKDIADMWIHESFINYSESLFVEYHYGKDAGYEYERGVRRDIRNDIPIIGIYDVNQRGSKDMYPKGSNMLHTIRQILNSDEQWRGLLRALNVEFHNQTVSTKQIEQFMIQYTGLDLQPVFDQYLRTAMVPCFEYYMNGTQLIYRWINSIQNFNMPLRVFIDGEELWLNPKTSWKSLNLTSEAPELIPDPNFYISIFNMLGK